MALYVDAVKVKKVNQQKAFEAIYAIGTKVPHSGIYKCINCGSEIAANAGDPFPPQNKAQHKEHEGKIEWQLLVYAQYD